MEPGRKGGAPPWTSPASTTPGFRTGNVNTSCHKGVREEEFNCLFCYCPLYRHPNCRGSFVLRDGIKDCSYCLLPHNGLESYAYIQAKLMESPGAWEAGETP